LNPVRLERAPGIRQLPGLLARRRDDLVVFDSWRGTYSDNPRAISETLHELRPDLTQVWVANDGAAALLPEWTTAVQPGSRGYFSALGRARYLVTNIGMPGYYRKAPGTSYLQTWHGTPLKRIALDIRGPAFAENQRFFDLVRRDVAKWDALVSQNAFSTAILRKAFDYEGRIFETGYPRNDLLNSPVAAQRREKTRRALGLPDSTRAVLYAPTWRDARSFDLQLDVAALGRHLGDGHAFLLRPHPHAPVSSREAARQWTIDVSEHPDIRDLLLAADILVTDYSSTMFDFAVTRKPMLFFTYDLAEYRDVMRGFYFDFEDEAPGPLLTTTDEVGDALQDLDSVSTRYAPAYDAFIERFCSLEDGGAAKRVVQAFFR
jgi:CDP-glycerol glycerophosphotransferase